MPQLPGQLPGQTAGQPNPLLDAALDAAVEHSIAQAREAETTPQVVIGNTPHVPQPDSRIVPSWATGIAVASIGVGAGSTGLGCAVWLVMNGLSQVSVPSLERFAWIIIAPFAGAAMLLTAGGAAISKIRQASRNTTNVYQAPVVQRTEIHQSKTTGIWARTDNKPKEN